MPSEIGQQLYNLREDHSYTGYRTADVLETSRGYLSAVENGKDLPSPEFVCTSCEFFGVDPKSYLDALKRDKLARHEANILRRHQEAMAEYHARQNGKEEQRQGKP